MTILPLDGPPPATLPPLGEMSGPGSHVADAPEALPDNDVTAGVADLAPPPPPPDQEFDAPLPEDANFDAAVSESDDEPDVEMDTFTSADADVDVAFDADVDESWNEPADIPSFDDAPEVTSASSSSDAPSSDAGERAGEVARSKIGNMYVYGGKGPEEFDCSGLVSFALQEAGLLDGYKDSYALAKTGESVPEGDMQPGDIVVYNGGSHVGICVAPGRVVHASQTGEPIEEGDIGVGGEVSDIRRVT